MKHSKLQKECQKKAELEELQRRLKVKPYTVEIKFRCKAEYETSTNTRDRKVERNPRS